MPQGVGVGPRLSNVAIAETIHVIITDSSRAVRSGAAEAGKRRGAGKDSMARLSERAIGPDEALRTRPAIKPPGECVA